MAKFKVGDWVALDGAGDRSKLRVLGVITDTCSGGTQIHYTCRAFCKDLYSRDDAWYPAGSRSDSDVLVRFNEIELVPFVEKETKKEESI